jgi:cytochrome P450
MSTTPLLELGLDPEVPGLFTRPDYYEVLARLRAEAPVFTYRPGCRLVARHADVREVSRDPERFCSGRGVLMNDPLRAGGEIHGSVLHMDPPEHTPWRQIVSRSFTPRAMAKLEGRVRDLTRAVLDGVPGEAEIDFVAEVAAPIPVLVIAELLDIPDADRSKFRRWSDACIEATDTSEPDLEAIAALHEFLMAHVRAHADDPGDDLVSALATAEVEGRRVTSIEAAGYCLALLVAGNETTRHLIAGAARALAEHPDQRRFLADDPARIPVGIEECLRWVTPIQAFGRTATRDTELGGVAIDADDFVVLLYASANRDEDAYGPTAGQLDVTRPVGNPHVTFGFGEHLCLGAALARLEGRVVFEELLARFPDYEITGEPEWVRSTLVRGMATLPAQLA